MPRFRADRPKMTDSCVLSSARRCFQDRPTGARRASARRVFGPRKCEPAAIQKRAGALRSEQNLLRQLEKFGCRRERRNQKDLARTSAARAAQYLKP